MADNSYDNLNSDTRQYDYTPSSVSLSKCPLLANEVDLSFCSGKNCRRCRTGYYDVPVSPLLVPNSCKSGEILKHKQSRFMVRCFTGVNVGHSKKYRFRWFVLTESDEALSSGIDFGSEFHKFIRWLRYYCHDFQYLVVVHEQGDPSKVTGKRRKNYHILSYGSDRLPVKKMRDYWMAHYKSTVTGMAEIVDIQKAVYYLAGYMAKDEKFIRSWCSSGWVFRGWLGFSRKYKQKYGAYPTRQEIMDLSLMSRDASDSEKQWMIETGYMSNNYDTGGVASASARKLTNLTRSDSMQIRLGVLLAMVRKSQALADDGGGCGGCKKARDNLLSLRSTCQV